MFICLNPAYVLPYFNKRVCRYLLVNLTETPASPVYLNSCLKNVKKNFHKSVIITFLLRLIDRK